MPGNMANPNESCLQLLVQLDRTYPSTRFRIMNGAMGR